MAKKAGRPQRYAEGKKQTGIWLTDEAIASATTVAESMGMSRSELFEKFARTIRIMQELQQQYHLVIRTPLNIGEPYFAGATKLGMTGWNGKPDYETSGATIEETIASLAGMIREGFPPFV